MALFFHILTRNTHQNSKVITRDEKNNVAEVVKVNPLQFVSQRVKTTRNGKFTDISAKSTNQMLFLCNCQCGKFVGRDRRKNIAEKCENDPLNGLSAMIIGKIYIFQKNKRRTRFRQKNLKGIFSKMGAKLTKPWWA